MTEWKPPSYAFSYGLATSKQDGVMYGLSTGGVFAYGWLHLVLVSYAIGPLARQDGQGKAKTVAARLSCYPD